MRNLLIALLILLPAAPLRAADPPLKTLTVDATLAPTPALRYRLLPEVQDQQPGNAALVYYRALLPESFHHRRMPNIEEKLQQWKKLPLAELPQKELEWLLTYRPLLEADQAARREFCDWELLSRLRAEGAGTLLPDMQPLRELALLNGLRTRVYLAQRDYAAAARSMQTGMSLARQVGDSPVLIAGLVGVAAGSITLTGVEEWVQTSQAPNLYWSLAVLPRPCIDFRRPLEGERVFALATLAKELPEALTAHQRVFSAEEAQSALAKIRNLLKLFEGSEQINGQPQGGLDDAAAALKVGLAITAIEAEARAGLLASGHNPALVKAMPAVQAAMVYSLQYYHALHDDLVRFSSLPYWEARPRLLAFENEMEARRKESRGSPLDMLIPAISRACFATVRLDRQIAALRNVEALRLYAAAHDGKFPAGLAELTEAPAVIDPVTGRDFEYRVEAGKAYLAALPPAGEAASESNSLRYEIVLRKPAAK